MVHKYALNKIKQGIVVHKYALNKTKQDIVVHKYALNKIKLGIVGTLVCLLEEASLHAKINF